MVRSKLELAIPNTVVVKIKFTKGKCPMHVVCIHSV